MRKIAAMVALCAMVFGGTPIARAGDHHLVTSGLARERLAEAAAQRAEHLALLDGALSTRGAQRAANVAGVDLRDVRRALPRLSDAELRDLAQRASALSVDPVAGHYRRYYHEHGYDDAVGALVVVMVVAGVAAVALAIADSH